MVGNALVGFRRGTINLLAREMSLTRISSLFLAYQMPECQVARVFSISLHCPALTIPSLAYQMPYPACWAAGPDAAASAGMDAFTGHREHRLRCTGKWSCGPPRCRRAKKLTSR